MFLICPFTAEWGGNPICWWLGLYFCYVCSLDEVSCTGCYWWLGDSRSCIQVVSLVRVLTIWYSLVIANTLFQQHKRRLYTWTSPGVQHWNQIDYILCSQRWRSSIQSTKTRPGADCGSDHELLITKFRLKLMKVGKTTRPFRYDLNQIPYDYTV